MIDRRQDQKWHRVATVRKRERMSLTKVSRRLGLSIGDVRSLENESQDLPLSMIYRWANALNVPVHEVLLDSDCGDLSPVIRDRARMVRVMKTLEAIRVAAESDSIGRLANNLRMQLIQIMPELDCITPWPQFGSSRGESIGRIATQSYPDPMDDFDST